MWVTGSFYFPFTTHMCCIALLLQKPTSMTKRACRFPVLTLGTTWRTLSYKISQTVSFCWSHINVYFQSRSRTIALMRGHLVLARILIPYLSSQHFGQSQHLCYESISFLASFAETYNCVELKEIFFHWYFFKTYWIFQLKKRRATITESLQRMFTGHRH